MERTFGDAIAKRDHYMSKCQIDCVAGSVFSELANSYCGILYYKYF